jgi:uncharacterized protein (TIGR03437 family)
MQVLKALTAILVLCGAGLSAQTISFLAPVNAFESGSSRGADMCPLCIATADFNGDGKMDILYSGTEFVPFAGVLLGNGDGTFRAGFEFNPNYLPSGPGLVAYTFTADFNADGKTDVALASRLAGTQIYLGRGDGTFIEPGTSIAPDSCDYLVAVADVNRDGKPDLICGASVMLGHGDGTFGAAQRVFSGTAAAIADFNRDGNPDVLAVSASGQLMLALGRGDGTFGPAAPVTSLLNPQTIQTGDFNDDGHLDIVGASVDGTEIVVLPGHGDGNFGAPIVTVGVPGPLTAVADFNHDGKLDLVAGDALLAGNGDGTFRFPVFAGIATEACNPLAMTEGGLLCTYNHESTAVADFNGDGLPDLASGYTTVGYNNAAVVSISVMLNDSPGNGFAATGISSATYTWPVGPGSLVSAFGLNLAPVTVAATSYPWPTTLGGIRLHVQDRSHAGDMLASLSYISPTQINYVMPSSDPFAWISIERVGSPWVAQGVSVPINALAAGLFTLGDGLAAASAVRISGHAEVPVAVTACAGSICTSVPIDLSGAPVYLSLYGTGFALAATSRSTCSIAGQTLSVAYAGPQMQLAGLDQINVLLPVTLAGAGNASVSCSLGAEALPPEFAPPPSVTNAVKLTIR